MPLYEYECQQCRRHTEKRQKFSDAEITECPHCGGPLKRVISAPAIAFKGGGWYADGYGNAKPKSSGESKGSGAESSAKPAATGDVAASTPPASTPTAAPTPPSAPASTPSKD